jgi:hypothetical protein
MFDIKRNEEKYKEKVFQVNLQKFMQKLVKKQSFPRQYRKFLAFQRY